MTNEHITDERLAEVLTEAYGSPEWTMADVRAARAVEAAILALRPAAQPARNDQFDYMLSTLRYVLGAGQAAAGESARDHYKAIIKAVADRASASDYDEVRYACEAVKRAAFCTPAAQPVGEPFGYFKAEPFGWTDCAETDEGAVALYERPQAVPEPIKPFFAVSIASRKWAELQEQGHRMQHVAFDGGPGGAGVIDPWGKVTWGKPSPERVPMTPGPKKNRVEIALETTLDRYNERHGITTPKADK